MPPKVKTIPPHRFGVYLEGMCRSRRDWLKRNAKKPGPQHSLFPPLPEGEFKIVKGDWVTILAGKDKGRQGRVCEIFEPKRWVYVTGRNTTIRRQMSGTQAMYLQYEHPINFDQVALIDPLDNLPCEAELVINAEGERVRVSKRSHLPIPYPPEHDVKSKLAGPRDTKAEDVEHRTYVPTSRTFRENILASLGHDVSAI